MSDHLPSVVFTDGLGPLQRWAIAVGDAGTVEVIAQRVADGETLKAVCRSRGWPYSVVARWVCEDERVLARYDQALRLWVDSIAMETVAISDEQQEVIRPDGSTFDANVPRDALRIKARQWAAEKLHRERYGAKLQVERSVSVTADAGLVGFAGELLARLARPGLRVVSEIPAEAVSSVEPVSTWHTPAGHDLI